MNIKMSFTGQKELEKILDGMTSKAEEAARKALIDDVNDLRGKAADLAPVDLGDLKGSAYAEVNGLAGEVGFTEPYATRQHEEVWFNHPKGGQAKYLETPYKKYIGNYIAHIKDFIARAVSR